MGTRPYTPHPAYYSPGSFTYKANDGKADSNTAAVGITAGQVWADLLVKLSASPNPVNVGTNLNYSMVAISLALGIAQNVVVAFDVPAGTASAPAAAPTG